MESKAKDVFLERVEALLNHISNYENLESCRADIVQTRADLLHRHAVRLGTLSIVEKLTIGKMRDIVDLLVSRTEETSVCFQNDLVCRKGNRKRFANSTHYQYTRGIRKNSAKTPVRIWYRLKGDFLQKPCIVRETEFCN